MSLLTIKSFAIFDHGSNKNTRCNQGSYKHMITGASFGTKLAIISCLNQIRKLGFDTRILEPALDTLGQLESELHFITVRWS